MCDQAPRCACTGRRVLALLAAAGAVAAAWAWAWEIAVIASAGGLAVTAACCIGIQVGRRHMVLAWPQRREVLSATVRPGAAAPVRSPRPVAGGQGVGARVIRGEVERGSIER